MGDLDRPWDGACRSQRTQTKCRFTVTFTATELHLIPEAAMSKTNATLIVQRSPDLPTAQVDDDLILLSVDQGAYFVIGGVGPRIWELLAEPTTLSEITRTICIEYRADEARCHSDVSALLQQLIQNGLVTES